MIRRVKLVIEYDGSALCGWQRQQNGPTVQGHLERCLGEVVGHAVTVVGASRTDAGVHAHGQVAVCEIDNTIPDLGLRRATNAALPPSIALVEVSPAADDWHPRYSATAKHYRYQVLTRHDRSPFSHGRMWHVDRPIDLGAIARALPAFVGTHDFSAFRAIGCDAATPVREIFSVTAAQVDPNLLQFDIHGNAFLRNMVRIVVGTLVDIGLGRAEQTDVAAIIASKDRTQAGQTAPPDGLSLMQVFYSGARPYVPRERRAIT
ncbi:MAG: tRNA pseudouridine(38-40) synthase TruA [Myxococcales bacterium]|nr:tRNA pseudouridine(38-40) synthase TruA [Myxococcales bacterium]